MMKVVQGVRPSRPVLTNGLTDDIWRLLSAMWLHDPSSRPTARTVWLSLQSPPCRFDLPQTDQSCSRKVQIANIMNSLIARIKRPGASPRSVNSLQGHRTGVLSQLKQKKDGFPTSGGKVKHSNAIRSGLIGHLSGDSGQVASVPRQVVHASSFPPPASSRILSPGGVHMGPSSLDSGNDCPTCGASLPLKSPSENGGVSLVAAPVPIRSNQLRQGHPYFVDRDPTRKFRLVFWNEVGPDSFEASFEGS